MSILQDISSLLQEGRAKQVVALVRQALDEGIDPKAIMNDGLLAGMAVIFCGCIFLPLKDFRSFGLKAYCSQAILFILMIAAGTTGYTIIDSQTGAILKGFQQDSALVRAMLYLFFIEFGQVISLSAYVSLMPWERKTLKSVLKKPLYPAIAGLSSAAAYGLVLIAMNHVSNVSFVQAFRQLSLPLGVLAGILFLKENPAKPKLVGVCLIVIGLIMTVL